MLQSSRPCRMTACPPGAGNHTSAISGGAHPPGLSNPLGLTLLRLRGPCRCAHPLTCWGVSASPCSACCCSNANAAHKDNITCSSAFVAAPHLPRSCTSNISQRVLRCSWRPVASKRKAEQCFTARPSAAAVASGTCRCSPDVCQAARWCKNDTQIATTAVAIGLSLLCQLGT